MLSRVLYPPVPKQYNTQAASMPCTRSKSADNEDVCCPLFWVSFMFMSASMRFVMYAFPTAIFISVVLFTDIFNVVLVLVVGIMSIAACAAFAVWTAQKSYVRMGKACAL